MESLFVMAQVAPTEYPKDNLEKADSLVKEAAEKYHPGMIIFPETFMSRFPAGTDIATANAVAEPLDGEFVQAEKDLSLQFRGSRNQRILKIGDHADFEPQ